MASLLSLFTTVELSEAECTVSGDYAKTPTIQAISRGKKGLQRGMIKPSMLPIEVQTKQKNVDQVRIVPRKGFYVVEVIYEQEVKQAEVNPAYYAGIDKGAVLRAGYRTAA